jgi:hypothetical protein
LEKVSDLIFAGRNHSNFVSYVLPRLLPANVLPLDEGGTPCMPKRRAFLKMLTPRGRAEDEQAQ